jgi:hexaprenyl-diphosphate synthase
MRRWSAPRIRVLRQDNYRPPLSLPSTSAAAVARTCRKSYTVQAAVQKTTSRHRETQTSLLQEQSAVEHLAQTKRTRPDPHALVAPELAHLRETLLNLLGSSHPSLTEIAKYYFLHPSKQLRPLLVLLFARATNGLGGRYREKQWAAECEGAGGRAVELDSPLTRPDVLNDWNPNMPDHTTSFSSVFSLRPPRAPREYPIPPPEPLTSVIPVLSNSILPTQMRLAQIVEMIHVASLLHDDVVDRSPLRRGAPSAPVAFGNKLTVLAGDFLLGRTSAALSRLGEIEVVELISSVITNLVEGEILQLKAMHGEELGLAGSVGTRSATVGKDNWNIYLQKTYMKTASLMAKGARAAVVLGGCREGEVWKEIAYAYGRNLGIAFQVDSRLIRRIFEILTPTCKLVDDILDYEAGEGTLGKPGGADLHLGLATGPALFAWEEHPEMGPLIERKFSQEGDVELVCLIPQIST